jgi:hypothetical protein
MNNYYEEMKQKSNLHAREPKVGDYWHDMFAPIYCVVDVSQFHVTLLTKTVPVGDDRWTWNTDHVEIMTRKDFNDKVRYRGLRNTATKGPLDDQCWCDVMPERDIVFAEIAMKNASVE